MPLLSPHSAGLGFRRELMAELGEGVPPAIGFFEVAPENWAGLGGAAAQRLRHRVFMEEGTAQTAANPQGRDADRYDAVCDHLMVVRKGEARDPAFAVEGGDLVGTYRLIREDAAGRANG